MKKFLLCMLLTGLMMPVIAQEKVAFQKRKEMRAFHLRNVADRGLSAQLPVDERAPAIVVDGWAYSGISKSYDRQAQRSVYPMTAIHDDGFIGSTWTNNDNPSIPGSGTPLRGVGYSYSTDGGITWSEQENRIGGIPVYWPSYAQWGAKGEAVLARSYDSYDHGGIEIKDGLVLLTRKTRGEGEWTITPVPYPDGIVPDGNHYMAWARMTTSGYNHQYIHIMSPVGLPDGETHDGYAEPIYYYRTQDGGATWDIQAKLIHEMIGEDWESEDRYFDAINFAVQGDIVACSFISFGSFGDYIIKSLDNGDTWKSTCFYYSNVGYNGDVAESIDTCYIPTQGCIALDRNGKVHVAFGVAEATNSEQEGYITYFSGLLTSFLSYWNEDMPLIDGNVDFIKAELEDMLFEDYFDLDYPDDRLYVNSILPQWPRIGYYTPTLDDHLFTVDIEILKNWMGKSYNLSGMFSFPQMAFDADNKLHIAYLGVLDDGNDDGRWVRHPYYTTRNEDGIWTETEYLVNNVDLIDREFAYLTLSGLYDNKMYLMAQVDQYAGTSEPYAQQPADHDPVNNYFYFFNLSPVPTPTPPEAINEVDYTPLTLNVYPNPTSGQVKVNFEGKGNITIYNMLGQTVYHVENVENQKDIPLNNMATGVYFVTVRSGNATATQKLIVK